MRFGIAKDIITPTSPMKLICAGGGKDSDFLRIHDDIYVKSLVLDDGTKKTILMSFDLALHDRDLNETLAEYALNKYGVSSEHFVLGCTHAHPVPAIRGYNPGTHSDAYEELLVTRAKQCIDRAMCNMMEGTMEYGSFYADFNISRRGTVNGVYKIAPTEEYPHDTEFVVICIRDINGEVRSVIMNYACHPVFYPDERGLSGEFPARLCQYLDAEFYGNISMFFQSAAGDVRPRPTADLENNKFNKMKFADVDRFAKEMYEAVLAFISSGELKRIEPDITADMFEIELPLEPKPLSFFEKYLEGKDVKEFHPCVVNAYHTVNGNYEKMPHDVILHCQLIRISETFYLATVGGEPCYGVKKAVQEVLDGKDICFIGYTDSSAYYVDDRMLGEGGYEPASFLEYGWIGPFKPGLDEKYREGFRTALQRIR